LPVPTEQELECVDAIQGRLTGDPSFEHSVPKKTGTEEDDVKVKEDVRIAGIVTIINRDVEIVPRKAYYRDSTMSIKKNPAFKGLAPEEIGLASSYFHFRPGFELTTRTLSERMNTFDESIDVFETIARDDPKG
jgi:radial spoke head protein 9